MKKINLVNRIILKQAKTPIKVKGVKYVPNNYYTKGGKINKKLEIDLTKDPKFFN